MNIFERWSLQYRDELNVYDINWHTYKLTRQILNKILDLRKQSTTEESKNEEIDIGMNK